MKVPLISIIVPTYNRSELLLSAINSMLQQETDGKFTYEIIIIDDASTDETREVIGEIIKHSPELVKYVKGEGKGYTFALNKGLAESHGEWVALFDDDELANPDWLKELYAFAAAVLVWLIINLILEDQLLTRPYFPVFVWMILLAKLGIIREES